MLRSMHGMKPDGTMVVGVEALRLAYRAVGLGAWVAPTALPILRPVFEVAYSVFATNRYTFSALFRPLIEHVAARRVTRRMNECSNGACVVPAKEGGQS
jgi:predicted DCC family thiol-disulfide oxidoreductase YuxK